MPAVAHCHISWVKTYMDSCHMVTCTCQLWLVVDFLGEDFLCHVVTWIWTVLEATEWHVNDAMTVRRRRGLEQPWRKKGKGVG